LLRRLRQKEHRPLLHARIARDSLRPLQSQVSYCYAILVRSRHVGPVRPQQRVSLPAVIIPT
jgi:hypothetical protein